MAKKIIIAFNSQPIVGLAFTYKIQIEGLDLVYPNGKTEVSFEYESEAGTDPDKVNLHFLLSNTINNTLAFLNANYSSPGIVYQRVNDTIEVLINIEATSVVYVYYTNPSIAMSTVDVSNITTVNLKYFFEYINDVKDAYLCQIFKKNYSGLSQEINGIATMEKASVENHLDPIRGGGLSITLEANKDLTLEDLYSESEFDFSVKLYKNKKLIFQGYLNPDGVYQDYVKDEWRITLDCVDGLGAISNLSFVQPNGLHFTGKMKAQNIIYQCLKRTGILMNINTSVNIRYEGQSSDDTFDSIYMDANRFVRSDNDTIMSCEDVLKSILDVFKACITQIDSEWYIYKPNEIYVEPYVVFHRYDISNTFIGNKTINLNKNLGSQIDNFYPHHCGGNQRIEIKGSVGGFRLGYKYGFVSGLMSNPNLIKTGGLLEYAGWNVLSPSGLINDPLKDSGFLFQNNLVIPGSPNIVLSDDLSVAIDDDITLSISYKVNANFAPSFINFRIRQGIYYLKYAPKNSGTPIEDVANAVWTTSSSDTFVICLKGSGTYNIQLPKILSDDFLNISIFQLFNQQIQSTTLISSLDIIPTQSAGSPEGEFHTVQRANRISSIVKPNQTVYNGDNPSTVYLGTIYKSSLVPTELWNRKNSLDKFPILRIAAEEELRIAQRPTKVFRGDFLGYISYLSLIKINNVGYFMPIEWSYNTFTNITTCKQLELFAPEVSDIVYDFTLDYGGNTVKPTII